MLLYDVLLTIGFITSTTQLQSQLLFISLVPITTAALRINWGSSVIVTGGMVMAYWLITWLQGAPAPTASLGDLIGWIAPHIVNGVVLIVAGLAIGRISFRMKQSLIKDREERETKSWRALRVAHQRASIIFEVSSR